MMIPGYELLGEVYRGRNRIVYRGVRVEDRMPVIIKTLIGDFPAERDFTNLKREYELLQDLQVDGVVKTRGLERYRNSLALILEDIPGDTLRTLIDARRVDLPTFFHIGVLLSQIV